MGLLTDHPGVRWAAPAAAVALIGVGAVIADRTASADPSLPPRSAAQLLADVQQARLAGLSGTVVQTSNLGLPELPGMGGGAGGEHGASSSLSSTISGTHTWRVWYAGPTRARLALVGSLGESDIIRNGRDVWLWSSRDKAATHFTLPDKDAGSPSGDRSARTSPAPSPTDLPKTPQDAAQMALDALDPTTSVTTSGSAVVAGRPAYELVLKPKTAGTLVAQVRISVDAEEHIPLRVQVFSTTTASPAFQVGFTQVSFEQPEAAQFAFNPPPGTTVTESRLPAHPPAHSADGSRAGKPGAADRPQVSGTGWSTVVVATLPADALTGSSPGGPSSGPSAGGPEQLQGILSALPRTSGSWGSGYLLKGTLFSAVVTDDGRVAVGAVAPELLYAALAAR